IISRESFEKENEGVKKLGEKPATGEIKANNPSLISSIVAATVTMQKLEEERRKKKARGW
ncbi:unnamed protein product, partial [marine sediment metagenome]